MDILGLIAVLSFGLVLKFFEFPILSCFGIGYSVGKDSNKIQK